MLNENIISFRWYKIKIWEENNNLKYQYFTILAHINRINSIFLLKDKNILIPSSNDGTIFWKITNMKILFILKKQFKTNLSNKINDIKKN